MKLGRRTFLQFVGVGVIAGKLDLRSPRPSVLTELVDNKERWAGLHIYAKSIKPARAGVVELLLGHGEAKLADVLVNAPFVGLVMCKPGIEEVTSFFDTGMLGQLPPTFRIVARSRATDDPKLSIGGELSLDYVPYWIGADGTERGLNTLTMSMGRRRSITG